MQNNFKGENVKCGIASWKTIKQQMKLQDFIFFVFIVLDLHLRKLAN